MEKTFTILSGCPIFKEQRWPLRAGVTLHNCVCVKLLRRAKITYEGFMLIVHCSTHLSPPCPNVQQNGHSAITNTADLRARPSKEDQKFLHVHGKKRLTNTRRGKWREMEVLHFFDHINSQ